MADMKTWPANINKAKFVAAATKLGTNDLAKKFDVHPSSIRRFKRYLRDNDQQKTFQPQQHARSINEKNQDEFIRDTFFLSYRELCDKYKISHSTVVDTKRRLVNAGVTVGSSFPKPLGRSFSDQLRLDLPSFICISDCEIPDHDPEWFELVVSLADTWGIKNLIINGDFVALDSLSSWMRQLARHQTFEDELTAAREALITFGHTFNNIYYLQANHERRLAHAIEGQMSFGALLKDIYNVTVSEYPYCWVVSNGEEYLICHPDNYSRIPLSVPLALSNINHKHLIVGHTHRLAEGRSKSGEHRILEGGHMRDLEKTAYKTLRINTHPSWNPGFVAVIDGIPWALDKEKALFFISLKEGENNGMPKMPINNAHGKRD